MYTLKDFNSDISVLTHFKRTKKGLILLLVTCPPKVAPMFKLGYGKTIKEAEYVEEAL